MTKAIDGMFGFEPLFDLSVRKAREKIVMRSGLVGVNWAESIDNMRRNMDELENEYDRLLDRKVWGGLRIDARYHVTRKMNTADRVYAAAALFMYVCLSCHVPAKAVDHRVSRSLTPSLQHTNYTTYL